MTITKATIIEAITNQNGLTKLKSSEVIENLLEIIKRSLESGEDVMISGFGKFSVKENNARKGRNPATGDDLLLRPRKVVTFKSSGKLRDRINSVTAKNRPAD